MSNLKPSSIFAVLFASLLLIWGFNDFIRYPIHEWKTLDWLKYVVVGFALIFELLAMKEQQRRVNKLKEKKKYEETTSNDYYGANTINGKPF